MKKKFGLVGCDISYSKSVEVHLKIAKSFGRDLSYDLISIPPNLLDQTIDKLIADGFSGFNVTKPYKQRVATKLGMSEPINTVKILGENLVGTNTDAPGFLSSLRVNNIDVHQYDQLYVMGAGDSAYLVAQALLKANSKFRLKVLCRDYNSEVHVEQFSKLTSEVKILPFTLESFLDTDLLSSRTMVIQATSAPHGGYSLGDLSESFKGYQGLFYDLCYRPASQIYYDHVNDSHLFFDGSLMLEEQARLAQDFWFESKEGE